MHFGKVSISSHTAFDKTKHLKRCDVFFSLDLDGKHYAWLDLPSTKTAKPGEIQSVFLVPQSDLCLLKALQNLTWVVPAGPDNPLFPWRDNHSDIWPMVKATALAHINTILKTHSWGTAFSHSFCIGGALFYLVQKIDSEIIHLARHWRSLAYEAYIRSFEQIVSQHLGDALNCYNWVDHWGWVSIAVTPRGFFFPFG